MERDTARRRPTAVLFSLARAFALTALWAAAPSVRAAPAAPVQASTEAAPSPLPGSPFMPLPGIPQVSSAAFTPQAPASGAPAPSVDNAGAQELSFPWVIGELSISGTRNIKPGAIRAAIKGRPGDLYDRSDMDRDRQAVYALGSFSRVAVDAESTGIPVTAAQAAAGAGSSTTVKMTFIVEEKPLVGKITFSGNKNLSTGSLADALTLKAGDPFDDPKLGGDLDKILEKYREKGYLAASSSYTVTSDTATWRKSIHFAVTEGPRSRIELVTLDGAKAFKPKKILKKLRNRRKKTYAAGELDEDSKKISEFYMKRGYIEVAVGTPTVTTSEDKTRIYIRFPVAEGPQHRFGESTFSGNLIYTSTELARALEYRKGKVFDHERYEETLRNIQEGYAEKGRLKMRVVKRPKEWVINPKTGLTDIEYHIVEGNLIYIDYVDVEGFEATKPHVIKREVLIKPGEPFSRSRVLGSRDRIMNLGFIDDVNVEFEQSPTDPDKVGVILEVKEGKPGLLTAGMAYSSTDGMMGTLSLSHLNLFGRAQRTSVQWQFGGRVMDYSINWMTPWILNKPTSLSIDLFNNRRVLPFSVVSDAYVRKQVGGGVNIGPRFKDGRYQLNFSYNFRRVNYSNINSSLAGLITESKFSQSAGGVSFAKETRDNYWDPSRGARHQIGLDMSGGPFGGDVHLLRSSLNNARHFTLFQIIEWPFVLSFYNRLSYVTQFGPTKYVPLDERFLIGGQDSLRGYSPSGEAGAPQGGRAREIFNIEFGFPLARERRKTIVKLVLFFDLGNTWYNVGDIRPKIGSGLNDLKTDVGLGLRFVTPAFPIRLDYGYGFNHKPGEKLYQINFGIGNLF